ncbi:tripartite tricarboxylate transporter family receptor [Bordetella bronchiseptica E014]|nr:ABC transporter substrate-binding protein [Bordetella bronchiseptica]KAK52345.1 tripartite tricarboxylate transporter family receptor [Bordetella bronchiseptica OSU054]KAK68384.1 tripartite tricarboxylate transporter family receptor [Bordetella bronchiseptica MO211]KAK72350.1 tripartite tricarboxylate transporter family receptor [Bordetella bronchiseptica CA90 BB02]KDB75118.1 tripartite tricarboxylate transporter family receptor [Bordetella bronchiseptica CA90 BB1334]KDC21673.1 tripartite t
MSFFGRLGMACAMLTLAVPLAVRSAYPEKQVRIIVPFASGSLTDVVFRSLAMELERELGQPVIIDNKPGASGIIGTRAALSAAPDGYTLVSVGVTNGASNKSLFKDLPYDPSKDFTSIGKVADSPFVLVVKADSPINSLADLYKQARAEPDSVRYGYASGSAQVSGAMLANAGDARFALIPYKSSQQILTDIVGQVVDVTLSDFAGGMALVRGDKLKALGVTSRTRFPLAPELPTLIEGGAQDYEITVWFGLVGPAQLPQDVQRRLSDALVNALKRPQLIERFTTQGLTATPSSSQEFKTFLDKEILVWGQMIKSAGLTPQ